MGFENYGSTEGNGLVEGGTREGRKEKQRCNVLHDCVTPTKSYTVLKGRGFHKTWG